MDDYADDADDADDCPMFIKPTFKDDIRNAIKNITSAENNVDRWNDSVIVYCTLLQVIVPV